MNALSVGGALAGASARTAAGLLPAAVDFLGGGAVAILNLGTPLDTKTDRIKAGSTGGAAAASAASSSGGAVLFHDNHVVLSLSDAEAQPPQTAVVLLSLDDASAQQNHLEIDHGDVLVNDAYGRSLPWRTTA